MPLSKPARNAFHENEHPRMKETTSWACSVTFLALCVYSMANVGCGAYSVPRSAATVAESQHFWKYQSRYEWGRRDGYAGRRCKRHYKHRQFGKLPL